VKVGRAVALQDGGRLLVRQALVLQDGSLLLLVLRRASLLLVALQVLVVPMRTSVAVRLSARTVSQDS
jgi:hypothetical protein